MKLSADILFSQLVNKQQTNDSIARLESAILQLNQNVKSLTDQTPKGFIFLKGATDLSSNVSANVLILAGPQVPQGYKATVKDFNVTFSTAAGAVRLVIMDSNYQIIQPLLATINSNTNGLGETVLESNQRLAIVGESAGAGKFTVYCSGIVQKNVRLDTEN